MGKAAATALDLVKTIFNDTALPWAAINNIYVSLHTADPSAGDQTTAEATYGAYDRVAVVRTASGWAAANPTSNVGEILFPECTTGTNVITHLALGTVAKPGTGQILYSGALTAPITVSALIAPRILAGQLTVTES
jgi:hypothetical protein